MANELQTNLKAAVTRARAISDGVSAKGGAWSEDDQKAYTAAIESAKSLKATAEKTAELDDISKWMSEPTGESAVKTGWAGEALPHEGDITEVAQEPVSVTINPTSGVKSVSGGELYALGKLGEDKLKALKSGAYKDAFVSYLRIMARPNGDLRAMKGEAMKVLQEGIDNQGGFWVPPDVRNELVKKMATITAIRQFAYSFTTGSDMVTFPKVVYTTNDQYTSGVRFSWTAEAPAADIAEATNPIAGKVQIPVETAIASLTVTRASTEDSQFDILGYLSMNLGEAFALGEDDAFINGDGVGKPQGILNHANATVATGSGGMYVASGSAAAIAWGVDGVKGVTGLEGALPPQYENNARFVAAKATYAALRALNTGAAGMQWTSEDFYPNFRNGYAPNLLGYAAVRDQFVPAIAANSYSAIFGDLQGYYIADRVGLSIEVLRELKALRDEVVIYARKRLGGQLVHDWKVKLLKIAVS